jgi:hypothetical protein
VFYTCGYIAAAFAWHRAEAVRLVSPILSGCLVSTLRYSLNTYEVFLKSKRPK